MRRVIFNNLKKEYYRIYKNSFVSYILKIDDVEEINLNDIIFENYYRKNPNNKKVTFNYNFNVNFYDAIQNEREITYESEIINRRIVKDIHKIIGRDTTSYYRWDFIEIINIILIYLYYNNVSY
jgi:hypothetical protein